MSSPDGKKQGILSAKSIRFADQRPGSGLNFPAKNLISAGLRGPRATDESLQRLRIIQERERLRGLGAVALPILPKKPSKKSINDSVSREDFTEILTQLIQGEEKYLINVLQLMLIENGRNEEDQPKKILQLREVLMELCHYHQITEEIEITNEGNYLGRRKIIDGLRASAKSILADIITDFELRH